MSKLDDLCKEWNKKSGDEILFSGKARKEFAKIPLTSLRLNYCLYGGLPRNAIIEFAGENNGGKTTTALDACANAQRLFQEEWEDEVEKIPTNKAEEERQKYLQARGPKKVFYVDAENTLDEDWAETLGVDLSPEKWRILRPQTEPAEIIFQIVTEVVETDEVGLVVIDSLGVMLSQAAYDKDIMEKTYAGISAPLTVFAKKMTLLNRKFDCTLIGINQLRDDMLGFGRKVTTGGQAWKYACTLRVFFEKGKLLDGTGNELKQSAETPSGNKVQFAIAKTKGSKPDRLRGEFPIMYAWGIDEILDTMEIATLLGMLVRSGAWYKFVDVETGEVITDEEGAELKLQGSANVAQYLADNEEFFNEFRQSVVTKLS